MVIFVFNVTYCSNFTEEGIFWFKTTNVIFFTFSSLPKLDKNVPPFIQKLE